MGHEALEAYTEVKAVTTQLVSTPEAGAGLSPAPALPCLARRPPPGR